jgi:azurin
MGGQFIPAIDGQCSWILQSNDMISYSSSQNREVSKICTKFRISKKQIKNEYPKIEGRSSISV